MNRIKMIAVIGATGMLGAPVTNILKKKGFAVTAVVRDPAKGSNRLVQNIHIQKGKRFNLSRPGRIWANHSNPSLNLPNLFLRF